MSKRSAQFFLIASVDLFISAVVAGIEATYHIQHYGILGALAAGLAVGSGITFSDGVYSYFSRHSVSRILVLLCLLLAASVASMAVTYHAGQSQINGLYYLNTTTQMLEAPFVFSIVVVIYLLFRLISTRHEMDGKSAWENA